MRTLVLGWLALTMLGAEPLWRDDFRDHVEVAGLSTAGWLPVPPTRLLRRPRATAVGLCAAGPRHATALTRLLPPAAWLVLEAAGAEPEAWAGLTLRGDTRQPGRILLADAGSPGRYTVPLDLALPEMVGRQEPWPLTLLLHGGTAEAPGPATWVRELRLESAPTTWLRLTPLARGSALRPGDRLQLAAALPPATTAVAVDFTLAGQPATPFSLDGRERVDLVRRAGSTTVWEATIDVTTAGTPWAGEGGWIRARASSPGQPDLWSALPGRVETAGPVLARPTASLGGAAALLPSLDGRLDDPAWRQVPALGQFTLLGGGPPTAGTQVRLLAGPDQLYLAALCEEPHLAGLRTAVVERDGPLWTDDCLEVFLDPQHAGQRYLHLVVNAAGQVYDAAVAGGQTDAAWDGPWQAATGRTTTGWTVELAVPWAVLGLAAGSDPVWGLNLARERYAAPAPERSSWAPLQASFHEPQRCGLLTAVPDLTAFGIDLPPPTVQLQRTAGGLRAVLLSTVTNRSRATVTLDLRANLLPAGRLRSVPTLRLAPGAAHAVRWEVDLPGDGRYELVWQATTVNAPELRCTGRRPYEARWMPVTVELTPRGDRIGAVATVYPHLTSRSRLIAELRRGEEVVAAQAVDAAARVEFSFAAADLPAGELALVVTLRQGDEVLGRALTSVHRP
ncbi:MAG: carbohydrate binding family 9 domain-containing protein [Fimbriimonadaceae bacterium]|nr:carbohydrate binding family 9 domain-containing protein [Fimbriimonadaceae bacterium]